MLETIRARPPEELIVTARTESVLATYEGTGITSRRSVRVRLLAAPAGHGVSFRIKNSADADGNWMDVSAHVDSVVNTMRNVTLGRGPSRLCIVEHLLAAVALWGIDDLTIEVDGPELPLGDGSAGFWLELLSKSPIDRRKVDCDLKLDQPVVCRNRDRMLLAIPDDRFSLSYMMDWDHPMIGKRWQAWSPAEPPEVIGEARTFGTSKEHKLLGLAGQVVSLTSEGFSKELRFEDEPVRHKILDLLGDLMLAGVNPQRWQARFISIKGGHELDVEMSRQLAKLVRC